MGLVNLKCLFSDGPNAETNRAHVQANLQRHLAFIDRLAAEGVEFIGFPELSLNGYHFSKNMTWLSLTGPEVQALQRKAVEKAVYISAGMAEQDADGKRWNTQFVIDPQGRIIGTHHKLYLTKEKTFTEAGTEHRVFEVKGARMGITICADGTDRKNLQALVDNGAQIIYGPHANSTGGTTAGWYRFRSAWGGPDGWIAQLKVHAALHNHAALYSPDYQPPAGKDGSTGFASGAWFIGPDGKTLGQMPSSTQKSDSREFVLVQNIPIVRRAARRGLAADKPKRPNVVFILTDDQRWDCMSIAGHPHLKTPNIDRLGKEGVYFKNAFCTTSLCSPSRASILSGLYAHSHRVLDNFTEYPNALPSFPKQLQAAGYRTAYIGKYHMGEENDEKRPGFDYFVTHKGQGKYWDTEFNVDGNRQVLKGYYTHVVTDLADKWLRGQRGGQPFLLMLGHKAPHSFYYPEPKYEHTFDQVVIKYPASAFQLEDKPKWFQARLDTWHGIYGPLFDYRKKFPDRRPEAVKDFAAMTRAYWGTIQSVDDSVGRLYQVLRDLGELDNTLFIFTTDNGLLNGEHGMVDKRTMHEPSIRVPLLVRYPGLVPAEKPRVIEQMVLTVDFAPSILDICGTEPLKKVHGQSWKRLAQGDATGWRTSWYYEYNYEKQFPYTPNVRGVRTDRYKYIRYPHGDGGPDRHLAELYDLRSDPEESRNLIKDPKHAGTVKELSAELERLMRESDALPDKMPIDEGIKSGLPDQKIR
jgi:N-acetylglucosamine-6-sulfatase